MTFPIDDFQEIDFELVTDTRTPKIRYFRNRARGNKAPFFMLTLVSPPLEYGQFMALGAKIEAYEGSLEVFPVNNPIPPISAFPDFFVDVSANKGAKSFTLDRVASYQPGDFIQFTGHQKVYHIANVTPTATKTTVDLTHPLLEDIAAGESVKYGANVVFQCSVESKLEMKIDATRSRFGVIDVALVEQG